MIKDSMKNLLMILFVWGIVISPLVSQEETSEESPFASTKRKVQLWKGEVVGVYKNRLWIKVRIYRNQRISKLSLSEIKSLFADTKEFPVYQKLTNIKQGSLVVRDTVWEEKHINKKTPQFIGQTTKHNLVTNHNLSVPNNQGEPPVEKGANSQYRRFAPFPTAVGLYAPLW